MKIEEKLKTRLDMLNKEIEIYKKNATKEIEKEQIIPATGSLLMLRDLKEQQILIKNILDEE